MAENGTTFQFVAGGKAADQGEVLVAPLAASPKPSMQLVSRVDRLCDQAVSRLIEVGAPGSEVGQLAHTTSARGFKRVLVVSLGDDAKLDAAKLRQAAGAAARWLIGERVRRAALWVDGLLSCNFERPVAEWVCGSGLAGFRFGEMKSADEKRPAKVRVSLRGSEAGHVSVAMKDVPAAAALVEAVNYTRRLAHLPPNVLHPTSLAAEARELARLHKLKCTVIDASQARRLGMNGLLAVGMASEHKPCLIRLDYRGNPKGRTTTVLVGKAITFDTGGISIKPAAGMEAMKFDKCGGCTVMGVMKAAAQLKLRCNLVGLIAAAENVLSDEAYRPSDILRMMNGKTVEVISTDAEGRLVLADALTYAQKQCDPTAIVDLATLTGGVVTALGKVAAGLMSNNDDLAAELGESGRRTHERLWRLPLWDDYRELIKGTDSDIKNSGGSRFAHAIVGGMFLKEFVDAKVPWAHLDIAGTATDDDSKNATGFGVRLLVDYLQRQGG